MASEIKADSTKKVAACCMEGIVVSSKMQKTVVIEVERPTRHPKFGKIVYKKKRYKVHDPEASCKVGNVVKVRMTAPISKTKFLVLDSILKQ